MALVGNINAHEPDGDSIFGALLPNVYVSRITLETISKAEGKTHKNPHIVSESDVSENVGISMAPVSDMKVGVDLVFKEKVEPDDVSLFTIDNIVNSLSLRIIMTTSNAATNYIMAAGKTPSNTQNIICDKQKMAQYITSNDFAEYSFNNSDIHQVTVSLKDISQFNGLFGGNGPYSPEEKFLLNLDKQVLSDGTVIYNIPYCAPDFIVPKASGGVEANHVSLFAVVYIDFDKFLDGQSSKEFVQDHKDQFQSLGYNLSGPMPAIFEAKAAADFKKLFKDFGTGTPMKNHVIIDGKVQNFNTEYVYLEGDKKDKVWYGPVHYHGVLAPAADGYVGWMGGTKDHMNDPTKQTPKLKEVKSDSPGEISDHRTIHELKQVFFDYTGFGTGMTFQELISPTPPESEKSGFAGLKGKITKSNSWLSRKESPVFSDPYFAIHGNGQCSFAFSLDMDQILRYNTALPGLLATVKKTSPTKYNQLIKNTKILSLNVFRKEVKEFKDDKGNHFLNEDQMPINIVTSKDGASKLLKSNNSLVKGSGYLGDGLKSGTSSNGNIREITLSTNNDHLRHFTVTDESIQKHDEGVFQYSVEVEMLDPLIIYMNEKIEIVKNARLMMENYLEYASSDPSFYNAYSNMFTRKFIKDFWGAYKSVDLHPIEGLLLFMDSAFWQAVEVFFNQVMSELKDMNGMSKPKNDILQDILTFISPITGSPSGIQAVLEFITFVEERLRNLVDSVSSTKSKKATVSQENTQTSKLSQGAKKSKNVFKVSNIFRSAFDSNTDAQGGYEYIFPSSLISEKPTSNYGLAKIGLGDYVDRMSIEDVVNKIPASFSTFPDSDPDVARPAYMSPLAVKLSDNKKVLNSGLNTKQLISAAVDIMEHNAGLASHKSNFLSYFVAQISSGEMPKANSSKMKVPNMINILSKNGVTFQKKGSGRTKSPLPIPPLLENFFGASTTEANYEDAAQGVYGPESTSDISPLLINLIMMKEAKYFKNIDFEDYAIFNTDGNLNLENELGGAIALSSFFTGYKKTLDKIPNHIKMLLNDIAESYLPVSAAQPDPAMAELVGLLAKNEKKSTFDKYENLVRILLTQRSLMKVEVLTGYETTVQDGTQMRSPKFELFDSSKLSQYLTPEVGTGYVIARLRPYSDSGLFSQPDSTKLPIFNEHFLLDLSLAATSLYSLPEELPSNSINEALVVQETQKAKNQVSGQNQGPSAATEEGNTTTGVEMGAAVAGKTQGTPPEQQELPPGTGVY